MIRYIADFADQAVTLPMVVLVAAGLFFSGWRSAAWSWAVGVPLVLALVLIARLFVLGCASSVPGAWNLRNPSGYVASATLVYGGLMALVAAPSQRRWVSLAAGGAVALAIGNIRLSLGVETAADVLFGGAIGLAGLWELSALIGERPRLLQPPWTLVVLALCLAVLLHGYHLPIDMPTADYAAALWPKALCSGG